jgi:membrane protein implicated in regulation of membrane protease activity
VNFLSAFLSALQIAIPTDPTQLLWLLIIFLIIGLIIIVVLGFLFAFPIAALAAIAVYFLTGGDLFLTGLTFLIVALIVAAIGKIWRASRRTTHTHEHEHDHEREHSDEHGYDHNHDHEHVD